MEIFMNISECIAALCSKDTKAGYSALKALEAESRRSATVYPYFDQFTDMLEDENSYIRTRALILIAANAKWDSGNQVDEIIDRYLAHITDPKPITARQCIQNLPEIAANKPELAETIVYALRAADIEIYPASMQSLVFTDIQAALGQIQIP